MGEEIWEGVGGGEGEVPGREEIMLEDQEIEEYVMREEG